MTTYLSESTVWETGVKEIETTEDVLGGASGAPNVQATHLANRTQWLKQQIESQGTALTDLDNTLTAALNAHESSNEAEFDAMRGRIFFFSQIM